MRRPIAARTAAEAAASPTEAMTPDREIALLAEARTDLASRLPALEQAKQAATDKRRDLLVGRADEAATAAAHRSVREADDELFAITDALADIDRRIAAAAAQRDAEADRLERERVAGNLERNAAEIQDATAAVTKAVAAVAKAHAMLAITISGTAAGQFDPHGGIASPVEIANDLLLQGLVAAMPGIGIEAHLRAWAMYTFRRPVEPADPVAAAAEFGERLRGIAGKIRSGEAGTDLPAHHDALPDFSPDSPEAEVYVLSPFQYVGADRARTMVTGGCVSLPVPVAERAIEVGVATDVPTRQWQNAQKSAGTLADPHQRTGGIGWDQAVDIGFDLAEWRRAEIHRRRDAWLSEQSRKAA